MACVAWDFGLRPRKPRSQKRGSRKVLWRAAGSYLNYVIMPWSNQSRCSLAVMRKYSCLWAWSETWPRRGLRPKSQATLSGIAGHDWNVWPVTIRNSVCWSLNSTWFSHYDYLVRSGSEVLTVLDSHLAPDWRNERTRQFQAFISILFHFQFISAHVIHAPPSPKKEYTKIT